MIWLRFVPAGLLMAGFPAWFLWWIESKSSLAYIYAVAGYLLLMIIAADWSVRRAFNKRH